MLDTDITHTKRIVCSGNVKLILADGYTLTAQAGMTVKAPNALTVYEQSGGAGRLISGVSGSIAAEDAGIGGSSNGDVGTITLNGGTVSAIGHNGIGDGPYSDSGAGGNIIITGGEVTARVSGTAGIAIGGNGFAANGTIAMTGGVISATGGASSDGVRAKDLHLGWTEEATQDTTAITASAYGGTVRFDQPYALQSDPGTAATTANMAGRTIVPGEP